MARRPPWDPLDREGGKAYAAFTLYRDLGPSDRSINRVVSEGKCSRGQAGEWSGKYKWVERARAFDLYVDQRQREKAIRRILSTNERIADVGEAFRDLMTLPIRAFLARMDGGEQEAALMQELSEMPADRLLWLATQTARILPQIVEVEQRALGVLREGTGHVYTPTPLEEPDAPDEQERTARAAMVMQKYGLLPPPKQLPAKTNGDR